MIPGEQAAETCRAMEKCVTKNKNRPVVDVNLGKPEWRQRKLESGHEGLVRLHSLRQSLLRGKTEEDAEEDWESSALYTLVLQFGQTLPRLQIPLSSSLMTNAASKKSKCLMTQKQYSLQHCTPLQDKGLCFSSPIPHSLASCQ